MSELELSPKPPVIKVVNPADDDAEATALAWDRGVVSLTADTLVLDTTFGEQVVKLPEGHVVCCAEPRGFVFNAPLEEVMERYG